MFRRPPEVWSLVSDNASISGTGKARIARIPYVTSHSLQHQPKNGNCRDKRYISRYKCSWQVDTTIGPNPNLYFYCVKNVEILVIWNAIREFVTETLIQLWWNAATQGLPRMREDISVSCQVAT